MLRTLIFATTFIQNASGAHLLDHWLSIGFGLNPNCDLLVVDSASPHPLFVSGKRAARLSRVEVTSSNLVANLRGRYTLASFPDNIGHPHRDGVDGWGRALVCGLQTAVVKDYDYVVHLEGDVLFRLDVASIVSSMKRHNIGALSTVEPNYFWLETGILFFSTEFVTRSRLIERYNWPVLGGVRQVECKLASVLGEDLFLKFWRGMRNDYGKITTENIAQMRPVWITHCNDFDVYDRFMKLTGLPSVSASD